jgi:hypothetical protein
MPALNITIKKKTGVSEYTELYPTTIISQVSGLQTALDSKVNTSIVGQPSGLATLDGSGQLISSQVPYWIVSGMRNLGGVDITNTNTNTLSKIISSFGSYFDYSLPTKQMEGIYFVITTGGELPQGPARAGGQSGIWGSASYDDGQAPTGTGDSKSLTLETGDFLIVTSVSKTAPNNVQVTFDVINNTHGIATTTTTGTAQLSSSTSTATTGTNVVTDGVLNGLLAAANTNLSGTTNENKLAPAAHHHDSLYLGISSNATSASQWSSSRTVTFATGTVTGSFAIDGTADVTNVALTYTGNEFYYVEGDSSIGDLVFETDPA